MCIEDHYWRQRENLREELLRLFQAVESLHYDETPLERLSLDDLDRGSFRAFLRNTGQEDLIDDEDRLLENWSLVRKGHPTVAGLLLFGLEPQRHLPHAQINAARFPGTDSSFDPSDRKDLQGRLFQVVDQAERFLDLHLSTPHEIRGFEPEPRPELPKMALREAVVNAVAHRDYTIRGPIRLFIFDDRIEIHTPGKPPKTCEAAALRNLLLDDVRETLLVFRQASTLADTFSEQDAESLFRLGQSLVYLEWPRLSKSLSGESSGVAP